MFTSKQQLIGGMGVDPEIAAFFVDRNVPKDNRYWKGRYLYIARGTGYLFIPLFFDLQFRAGMAKEDILDPSYVSIMEKILDYAAKFEFGEISFTDQIAAIQTMIEPLAKHTWLMNDLREYFKVEPLKATGNLGLENSALNRGDALLYLLCVNQAPTDLIKKVIGYWYLLVPSFLLLDDIMDFNEDRKHQEENALSYYGYDAAGVIKAIETVERNFKSLEDINPLLGEFFQSTLEHKKKTPYFQHILNN
ncbi:hypothetical protein [Flavihumibacter sp. ZG627]|uniref:hypothetical protein n=1 Tax=Flavihumibacter sp. ZG627 TaxID=1463156 RepID=UPI00057F7B54|nr:hypothetical protein [Flavihumibacter sp. ZG627]KIC89387.1 hypothetical protein HY58_17400 [Flavihumibacter sp. ZG627]